MVLSALFIIVGLVLAILWMLPSAYVMWQVGRPGASRVRCFLFAATLVWALFTICLALIASAEILFKEL